MEQQRDDFELMQRVARDDEGAIGELYARFGALVYQSARQVLRSRAETEQHAVFDTPRMRPVMYSEVSTVHRLLCATRSPVRLSNSITAGARNNSASSSFRHSSSSAGNVVGVPLCGVANAVINSRAKSSLIWKRDPASTIPLKKSSMS